MCQNGWDSFFYFDGLQPKMSAGMIKEHECIFEKTLIGSEAQYEGLYSKVGK